MNSDEWTVAGLLEEAFQNLWWCHQKLQDLDAFPEESLRPWTVLGANVRIDPFVNILGDCQSLDYVSAGCTS